MPMPNRATCGIYVAFLEIYCELDIPVLTCQNTFIRCIKAQLRSLSVPASLLATRQIAGTQAFAEFALPAEPAHRHKSQPVTPAVEIALCFDGAGSSDSNQLPAVSASAHPLTPKCLLIKSL